MVRFGLLRDHHQLVNKFVVYGGVDGSHEGPMPSSNAMDGIGIIPVSG